jgi:hypothetical protein
MHQYSAHPRESGDLEPYPLRVVLDPRFRGDEREMDLGLNLNNRLMS